MKTSMRCGRGWAAVVALAGVLAVGAGAVRAGTIHVSAAGNDSNGGLSWATAKKTVQGGLDAAAAGDEVWVRAGTYNEVIALREGVGLYGGFAGAEAARASRDWTRNVTVLNGNNVLGAKALVTADGLASATIDGFTIRNSLGGGISCADGSLNIANNIITANTGGSCGGAIHCVNSSAVITANRIAGNNTFGVGGVYSVPTITGNTITSNADGGITWSSPGGGLIANNTIKRNGAFGGIACGSGSPTIRDNTVTGNTGPGIWCGEAATIVGNTVSGNLSGGINAGAGTILNNLVAGNTVNGENGYGGGIRGNGSPLTIGNNVIVGNTASMSGGGISCMCYGPTVTIANNTVAYNTAAEGGGIYCFGMDVTIANTVVAFNSSGIYGTEAGTPSLRYNCVFGNVGYRFSGLADPTGSDGNIAGDPRFVRAARAGDDGIWGTPDDNYGDLHLLPGSPCIDAGNNADVQASPPGIVFDYGLRFSDDPYTVDTGAGTAPIVDMGAYEYRCGDINGSGYVDVEDLLCFIDTFGAVKGDGKFDARCDFNTDDAVDVVDLLTLVESFGV